VPIHPRRLGNGRGFAAGRIGSGGQKNILDHQTQHFAEQTASLALKAMLYEVCAAPKPGLVDGRNNGAHIDMSIFHFVDGSLALLPCIVGCVLHGVASWQRGDGEILPGARKIGKQGEAAMFGATGGVNTQKGLLFSLGLLGCTAGILHGRHNRFTRENFQHCLRGICVDLVRRELKGLSEPKADTAGKKLFLSHGTMGVRGEAEAGFPNVFEQGLPFLEQRLGQTSRGKAFVDTLLKLMTVVDDTNVIKRGGLSALALVRERAAHALKLGGATSVDGMRRIMAMDREFIHLGISPGGSADLLAATIFMHLFFHEFKTLA
jgi:holo-ACP synthase/triphosphoribosyl-dephospho-CoA synthase